MKFVHQELHTTDPTKAKAFYRALFGWTFQDMDMPEGPYTMINTTDGSLGGMMAAQDGMPPTWIGYIDVDSVERIVARAIEAGAKVLVPKTDVGGFGYMAWLQDPQGATFAVWQSTTPAQSDTSAAKAGKKAPKKASKKASKKAGDAPAEAAPEKASKKAAKKSGKKASKAAAAPAPAPAKKTGKKTAKTSASAPAAAPAKKTAKKSAAAPAAAPAKKTAKKTAPAKAAAKAPAAKKAAKAQPAAPKAAPAGKKKSGKG